ncbi:MAG: DJ-1 family glyoxalase III [Verrucomicrobiia bacterium]
MTCSTSVLAIIPEGFEEIELITPVDLLRRAGSEVVLAGLTNHLKVSGRCGISLNLDHQLAALTPETFGLLLLPGGPGVRVLREDGRAQSLAKQFLDSDRWVAAICAAPSLLFDAGLLVGKRFTAHSSVAEISPGALLEEEVVVDGRVVTSRGAGTALPFGLQLVAILHGAEKAHEIARAIMVSDSLRGVFPLRSPAAVVC